MEARDRFRTDAEVGREVARVLGAHEPLKGMPIFAKVSGGCVAMSGTVQTWKHARDACRLAHTVEGVVQLKNDLVVEPCQADRRTDQELAAAADDAIRTHLLVSNDIRAKAEAGVVTLEGTVAYASERYDAEVALERVCGLRGVVNLVQVETPSHVDLRAARDAAIQALKRHAVSDGLGLSFEERNGTLQVAGSLDSPEEKTCVLAALRDLPGVRHLVDEIRTGLPAATR